MAYRVQKSDRRALPAPVLDIIMIIADAFPAPGVEIVVARQAHLLARLDHPVCKRIMELGGRDMHRAAHAMLVGCAKLMILNRVEGPQHGVPAPSLRAALFPLFVIFRLAPDIDHAIDSGRAAQASAPQPDLARVQSFFTRLLDREILRKCRVADQLRHALWHANEHMLVLAASFQKQHPIRWIFRKLVGKHATSAACTDNDEVELLSHDLSRN